MSTKDTNPKDAIGVRKWRQFFVVPRQVLWEVGVGMLEGSLKYGRHNYRAAGVRASVYCDAAMGHIEQFIEGEDVDQDSGLSHVTKAICSLVVLRDAMMNGFWEDDRPPKVADLDGVRERLQEQVEVNFARYEGREVTHYTELEHGSAYRGERVVDGREGSGGRDVRVLTGGSVARSLGAHIEQHEALIGEARLVVGGREVTGWVRESDGSIVLKTERPF